jgi:Domain of unknown function (DUF4190)
MLGGSLHVRSTKAETPNAACETLPAMTDVSSTPPGFYADDTGEQRWWDGAAWGVTADQAARAAAAGPAPGQWSGLAITSFVAGIVLFPFLGCIVALVTGLRALDDIKRTGKRGRGFAIAGLVLAGMGAVVAVAILTRFVVG